MTQKQLERLSRKKLLELLVEQTGKSGRLERENTRLKERIRDREEHLTQMSNLVKLISQTMVVQGNGQGNTAQSPQRSFVEATAQRPGKNLPHADGKTAQKPAAMQKPPATQKPAATQKPPAANDALLAQMEAASALLAEVERMGQSSEEEGDGDGEGPEPPSKFSDMPTREQLLAELHRESSRGRYIWSFKTTVSAMVLVAAVAVLIAVLLLPVLRIYGTSMNPSLYEGDYVVCIKGGKMNTGDMIAFYYNNKILVKRVIGQAGQWIDITPEGEVYVDNERIDEPYLMGKAFGECDLELPYQVPENRVFVMGDNRATSVDSRSTAIGCIAEEQLVGKIVFRIWPVSEFGSVKNIQYQAAA